MTRPSDEMLIAYADGELDEAAASEVEAAIADAPELGAQLRRLVTAGVLAERAFAAPAAEPIPDNIAQFVLSAPAGDRPRRPAARPRARPRSAGRAWPMALAACFALLAGLGLGRWTGTAESPAVAGLSLQPAASPAIADALDRMPSYAVAEVPAGSLTVLDSFDDAAGRFCRIYTVDDGTAALEAIACHEADRPAADRWRVVTALPLVADDTDGVFRLAGGTASLVDAALAALGAGPPLDPAAVSDRQAALGR